MMNDYNNKLSVSQSYGSSVQCLMIKMYTIIDIIISSSSSNSDDGFDLFSYCDR